MLTNTLKSVNSTEDAFQMRGKLSTSSQEQVQLPQLEKKLNFRGSSSEGDLDDILQAQKVSM